MTNPLVSIIVLNWNGLSDTDECLKSIDNLDYPNKELILIDNGSIDGSKTKIPSMIGKLKTTTQYVDLPKNTGFTGGNLEGLKKAKGEYILMLNNDAVIDKQAISVALRVFRSDQAIAAVGGRAYWLNDKNPAYDKSNSFYSYQIVNPWTAEVETLEYDNGTVQEVNNVSGSCVMIKRSTLEDVGFFDKRFFAYYEETDLFARMKRRGYKVVYCPDMAIWHKVGASTTKHRQMYYYLIFKNQLLFAANNFDNPNFKYFIYRYYRSFFGSVLKLIITSDKTLQVGRLRAGAVNLLTMPSTLTHRHKRLRLSTGSYNSKILQEQGSNITYVIAIHQASQLTKLSRTIKSLDTQNTLVKDVVIVAPDSLVKKIENKFLGLRVVRNKVPSWASSYKIGIVCSKEDWVVFVEPGQTLDSDANLNIANYIWRYPKKDILAFSNTPQRHHLISLLGEHNKLANSFVAKHSFVTKVGWEDDAGPDINYYNLLLSSVVKGKSWSKVINTPLFSYNDGVKQYVAGPTDRQLKSYGVVFSKWHKRYYLLPFGPIQDLIRRLKSFANQIILATKWLFSKETPLADRARKLRNMASLMLRLRIRTLRAGLVDISSRELKYEHVKSADTSLDLNTLPVFINCRDRVTDLRLLVSRLEGFGLVRIVLIDNNSSYPELLRYYSKTKYQVLPLGRNVGHTAPWDSGAIRMLAADSHYIVSDPDVIPVNECPSDAVEHFYRLLVKYPKINKVGFGLKIDDLPMSYKLRETVMHWEAQFWKNEIEPSVYAADIDTTFALYRPNLDYILEDSLRTGAPYIARHMPWYQDSKRPTEEDSYYREHASSVNTWNKEEIPERFKKAIEAGSK